MGQSRFHSWRTHTRPYTHQHPEQKHWLHRCLNQTYLLVPALTTWSPGDHHNISSPSLIYFQHLLHNNWWERSGWSPAVGQHYIKNLKCIIELEWYSSTWDPWAACHPYPHQIMAKSMKEFTDIVEKALIHQETTSVRCTQRHFGFLQNHRLLVVVHTVSGKLTEHGFVNLHLWRDQVGKYSDW